MGEGTPPLAGRTGAVGSGLVGQGVVDRSDRRGSQGASVWRTSAPIVRRGHGTRCKRAAAGYVNVRWISPAFGSTIGTGRGTSLLVSLVSGRLSGTLSFLVRSTGSSREAIATALPRPFARAFGMVNRTRAWSLVKSGGTAASQSQDLPGFHMRKLF